MKFKVLGRFEAPPYNAKSKAYLTWDNWNDFSYLTLFGLIYVDENSTRHTIGSIKIGYVDQGEGERRLAIGDVFDTLQEDCFSLGQSDEYYENLNKLGTETRDDILLALRDIAKMPEMFDLAIEENVTRISLLRYISKTSVLGQFRRLANGGVRLTNYSFQFKAPKIRGSTNTMELSFNVEPESFPPTNIHVLIGRNGVGKTHLINNMINSLVEPDPLRYGKFISDLPDVNQDQIFANLTSITFSAFDATEPQQERKDKTQGIQFSYIGLKRFPTSTEKNPGPKSTVMLRNEFFKSLGSCIAGGKVSRWKKSIEMLESDPNFQDAAIGSLADIQSEEERKRIAFEKFWKLSSGHKIILLTVTRLVETLQEKSLVLIDEPEAHLHPPLLSAFTRTLSDLLMDTNSVAIIATHSPVVLQEVPRSCVWKLRRIGAEATVERLSIESFGENVGTLTNEIFGLEVTESGYYKILTASVRESTSFRSVLRKFDGQLGMEAQAVVRSLIAVNNLDHEDN
ncbi:MAG: AAA family ATPase [Bacteroidetes bacterium]|nr:AAA family ATPase [Bacteroidota bacterium]